MIICVCNGTSDRQVARAIQDGANSLCDLQSGGIGVGCGACHETLERTVESARRPCGAESCSDLCAAKAS